MNRQEIFDKVARHLLTQGKKARSQNGQCLYLYENDDETLRCAVGCLIPDELYDPEIEGAGVTYYYDVMPVSSSESTLQKILIALEIDPADFPFLTDLQKIHDGRFPENWLDALREIADCFHLNPAVLNIFDTDGERDFIDSTRYGM